MLQVFVLLTKWMSIPALLIASMFSYAAGRYESFLAAAVIVASLAFVKKAVESREYSWAAGLVAIIVAFSPLFLATKLFLMMGLICTVTLMALVAALRPRPLSLA